MTLLTVLGEILPVLATVLLLGLWLYQQTEVESRSRHLQQLSAARTTYLTYQSHNAVFNAIHALAEEAESERIRQFQVYNYELGLRALEEALPESDRQDVPEASDAYSSDSFGVKMERTQTRLEMLQHRLAATESNVAVAARRAKTTYVRLYLGLSLLAIAGTVCKLLVRVLWPAAA